MEPLITHDHAVLIFNVADNGGEADMFEWADHIRSAVKTYLRHTVTIGVGTSVEHFHELSRSYYESLQALRLNWMKPGDTVLSGISAQAPSSRLIPYPSAAEEEIMRSLHSGDDKGAREGLERFVLELAAYAPPFHISKTYYLQLLVSAIRLAQQYEEELNSLFAGWNPYDDFFRLEDRDKMTEWFRQAIFPPLLTCIIGSKKKRRDKVVQQTFRIVMERYAEDLSLQSLAEELRMNPSYVSLIFKEETGETFINYVTKVRIKRAKELLGTDLTVSQIAKEIGYANAQHLIRVFKKQEGRTPGEYRAEAFSKGDY